MESKYDKKQGIDGIATLTNDPIAIDNINKDRVGIPPDVLALIGDTRRDFFNELAEKFEEIAKQLEAEGKTLVDIKMNLTGIGGVYSVEFFFK